MPTADTSHFGSLRRKSGFSLFGRRQNDPALQSGGVATSTTTNGGGHAISAPLAMSASAGAAAGIPGFIPSSQPQHGSTAQLQARPTGLAPQVARVPKEMLVPGQAQRVAEWASGQAHRVAMTMPGSMEEMQSEVHPVNTGDTQAERLVPVTAAGRVTMKGTASQTLLIPTSFSPGSGLTASSSIDCISASTSRNTVMPALHPIMNTTMSGKDLRTSTSLPPSASGGAAGMSTLGSAIKLGAAADVVGNSDATGPNGTGHTPIIHSMANQPQAKDRMSTLPRSTSGTSIFSYHRPTARKISGTARDQQPGGESLGRRISRRLSIDGFRPRFGTGGGNSKNRRSVIDADKVNEFGALVTAKPQPEAAVNPEKVAPPPIIPGKEKMLLPGLRSWRSRFKSNVPALAGSVPTLTRTSAEPSSRPGSRLGHGSVRSRGERDSWVDVGSMRSRLSKNSPAGAALRPLPGPGKPDERVRPIGSTVMKARVFTSGSEHENVYRRSYLEPKVTAEEIDAKVERLLSRFETVAKTSQQVLASTGPPEDAENTLTTGLPAAAPEGKVTSTRFSPARDDMSVLDPLQSRTASPASPLPPVRQSLIENQLMLGNGLPSSRSLNALESTNLATLAGKVGCGAIDTRVEKKRSLAAIGSSTFGTKAKKEASESQAISGMPTKSRPASTISNADPVDVEAEADVSIVTATRHKRLPMARSYSGSIADHLSILSASSSGMPDPLNLFDSRASLSSIVAGRRRVDSDADVDLAAQHNRAELARDESTHTFHTAPSGASIAVSGPPHSSPSRQALSVARDQRINREATARPSDSVQLESPSSVSPPRRPSVVKFKSSPSLIERMEQQQGQGWWSVSRPSRLAVPPAEAPVSPTGMLKVRRARRGEDGAANSGTAVNPFTGNEAEDRGSAVATRSSLNHALRFDKADNAPHSRSGSLQSLENTASHGSKLASRHRSSLSRIEPDLVGEDTMPVALSQTSIALSLICPSPSPSPSPRPHVRSFRHTTGGTHSQSAESPTSRQSRPAALAPIAIPLTLAPPVALSSPQTSNVDIALQLRSMRDKHERELDAILDSLYQAKQERDRVYVKAYTLSRSKIALKSELKWIKQQIDAHRIGEYERRSEDEDAGIDSSDDEGGHEEAPATVSGKRAIRVGLQDLRADEIRMLREHIVDTNVAFDLRRRKLEEDVVNLQYWRQQYLLVKQENLALRSLVQGCEGCEPHLAHIKTNARSVLDEEPRVHVSPARFRRNKDRTDPKFTPIALIERLLHHVEGDRAEKLTYGVERKGSHSMPFKASPLQSQAQRRAPIQRKYPAPSPSPRLPLPSIPSGNMIKDTTPLPDVPLPDSPEGYTSACGEKVPNGGERGEMMSRTNTGSGSETVCDPDGRMEEVRKRDALERTRLKEEKTEHD